MKRAVPEDRSQLTRRIRRIGGQLAGIERMLEENRSCEEILTQLAAVREAVNRTGMIVIQQELTACLERPEAVADRCDTVQKAVGRLFRFSR